MITRGIDIRAPLRESADVCIIGSGCGGGASAKVLAEAGKKVVVIEEGGYFTSQDFDGTEEPAYLHLYQQRGAQATEDLSVTVLQGRCVGGSSLVNWTTSLRPPEFVLRSWAREFGITGLALPDLEPYFERVERYLNVHQEPDENHSPNNRIILDGARKLGYQARASGRNTRNCMKAGACGLGCPFDAKLSVDRTYIPDATRAGATVFADCRAELIELQGTLKRVNGSVLDQETRKAKTDFSIEAPVVIVAGSAIQSPVLLNKSGLANSSGHLGKNLTFHLTTAVMGLYDRVIYGAGGIPQSALCDQFINKNGDGGGYWIESVPIYPVLAALALPGFGDSHRAMMRQFPYIGALIVLVKEIDSQGEVAVNAYGRPSITYTAGDRDRAYLKQGVTEAVRLHFAAGAKEVMTLHARRTSLRAPQDVERILDGAEWGPNRLGLYSAHPLGTCRMAHDPRRGVLDENCQTHDVRGLFVIDGSFSPTSLGVNPQITILAVAEKSAEWIVDHYRQLTH